MKNNERLPKAGPGLARLRGRSLGEFRDRGKQELARLGGRVLGHGTGEMSDEALLAEFEPRARVASCQDAVTRIARRIFVEGEPGPAHRPLLPFLGRRLDVS